jgi:hypothetical protein
MTATSDVLDVVKTFASTEASEAALFKGDGVGISRFRKRRENDPSRVAKYRQDLLEVAALYKKVLDGDRYAALDFTEAMSTSDFPILFGDILDRSMLANYNAYPMEWRSYARVGRVRDFRSVKRFTMDGGEAVLTAVAELTEYPAAAITEGQYTYKVGKYGKRFPLSWETYINDDLDQFRVLPEKLARSARRTEERFVTDLFAGPSGPDGTFFSVGNANLITDALDIEGLETAFETLAAQRDTDGNPIYINGVTLVVPPALEVTANNIKNAIAIWTATGSGGVNTQSGRDNQLQVSNWLANRLTIVVNPWLPIISSTANGNTSWYLFANPSEGRPAMEVGFLTGHEAPELFQKTANAVRVGGGPVGPEEGDFDTDSVDWKVRHVLGGTLMDPKSAIASNGTT